MNLIVTGQDGTVYSVPVSSGSWDSNPTTLIRDYIDQQGNKAPEIQNVSLVLTAKQLNALPSTALPPLTYKGIICSISTGDINPHTTPAPTFHKKLSIPPLLTSQYSRPHVDQPVLWQTAWPDAHNLHPGEIEKDEVLQRVSENSGFWVYWGHGEFDRLRGYGHISTPDLLKMIPQQRMPVDLSIWLSCNTLADPEDADNDHKTIGRQWYTAGGTQCLLAASEQVPTELNERFSNALLETLITHNHGGSLMFVQWLSQSLARLADDEQQFISGCYKLLGTPGRVNAVQETGAV